MIAPLKDPVVNTPFAVAVPKAPIITFTASNESGSPFKAKVPILSALIFDPSGLLCW